jgi:predicted TIM-barrel fold metal-dependent hydrolase
MIIDAHVHVHPDPKGFGDLYDASLDNLMHQMKNVPIDKIILLPIAPKIPNSFVAEICKMYPDKLVGLASADPKRGKRAIEEFEEEVLKYDLKGLKLHPRMQNINGGDFENLLELVKISTNMNLTIVIDAFYSGENIFKIKSLELINQLAIEIPEAKIVICHSGGYKIFEAMMIAKMHRNIFLDLSFSLLYFKGSSIINDLGYIVKKVGSEKFIYGSDFPQYDLEESLNEVYEFLDGLKLGTSEKERILGENSKRIFGI